MFNMDGSAYGTIQLGDVIYNGKQDEIRIAVNWPFYYGHYFFVGGVRYYLAEETATERIYRAQR